MIMFNLSLGMGVGRYINANYKKKIPKISYCKVVTFIVIRDKIEIFVLPPNAICSIFTSYLGTFKCA